MSANRRSIKNYSNIGRSKYNARSNFQRKRTYAPSRKVYVVKNQNEPGFVDLTAATYNCNTTGSIALIATIPQNASTNGRIGKRVSLKSLQCHGSVIGNAAVTITDIAILIVYDKRPTGTLPAITDILVSATASSFNNDNNSGRFRILKRIDKVLIGSAANQYTSSSAIDADWFLSLRSLPSVFKSAGTGAMGDIEEGALYVVTVGSSGAGTSAATANLSFRTRYVDV